MQLMQPQSRPALPVLSYLSLVRMPTLNLALDTLGLQDRTRLKADSHVWSVASLVWIDVMKLQDGLDTSAA